MYAGVETKRGHEEAVTQGGCSSAWRVEWYPEPHLVSLRGEPTDRSSPGRIMIQDKCIRKLCVRGNGEICRWVHAGVGVWSKREDKWADGGQRQENERPARCTQPCHTRLAWHNMSAKKGASAYTPPIAAVERGSSEVWFAAGPMESSQRQRYATMLPVSCRRRQRLKSASEV